MNNKILSFLVSITVILLAVNYSPEETLAEETAIIQKSEDVIVVSNPKTPAHKMRIVFKEELTIGKVEGDENYMFGGGIAFNTDDEGKFYVSDYDNHRILKYDTEGKYLLTIGREGQGPGEFRSLSVARFDKDNNFYITDAPNRRISFFDKEGKYLRQIRMTERLVNPYINSKGFIVANKWNMFQEGNVMKQTSIYGLFDDKFNLVEKLYQDEVETLMPKVTDASSLSDLLAKMLSAVALRPVVRYALTNNDFIYFGYPDKYEINVYSPEGKLARRITRDYDLISVNEKDKESFVKMASVGFSAPIYTEDVKKKAFQKIKYPKYKPAYQSFTLMDNGWLVVMVDSIEYEYSLFDIFDKEGKYIAHFKTPVAAERMLSEFFFFKNGKAYTVVTEDEYWFVKRYNIELQEYKEDMWVKSSIKLTR